MDSKKFYAQKRAAVIGREGYNFPGGEIISLTGPFLATNRASCINNLMTRGIKTFKRTDTFLVPHP